MMKENEEDRMKDWMINGEFCRLIYKLVHILDIWKYVLLTWQYYIEQNNIASISIKLKYFCYFKNIKWHKSHLCRPWNPRKLCFQAQAFLKPKQTFYSLESEICFWSHFFPEIIYIKIKTLYLYLNYVWCFSLPNFNVAWWS